MKEVYEEAHYTPEIFDARDMDYAKKIILTNESDVLNTEQRWLTETPHLIKLMESLNITKDSLVLDYGCGVGRLSKAIIEKYDCEVVGMDISINMRALAHDYVGSHKFFSVGHLAQKFFLGKFDVVICVWVLQHVFNPETDIPHISLMMKSGARMFVVNEIGRVIPTNKGWLQDKKDVWAELSLNFKLIEDGKMDPDIVGKDLSKRTYWAIFEKE